MLYAFFLIFNLNHLVTGYKAPYPYCVLGTVVMWINCE